MYPHNARLLPGVVRLGWWKQRDKFVFGFLADAGMKLNFHGMVGVVAGNGGTPATCRVQSLFCAAKEWKVFFGMAVCAKKDALPQFAAYIRFASIGEVTNVQGETLFSRVDMVPGECGEV